MYEYNKFWGKKYNRDPIQSNLQDQYWWSNTTENCGSDFRGKNKKCIYFLAVTVL